MKWFTVQNLTGTGPVELLIYDEINEGAITASGIKSALEAIPKDRDILCRINSPGGSVWDGLAIFSCLEDRKSRVTCRVDGLAGSISSVIACAGQKTQIARDAMMMIHLPSTVSVGTSDDLRTAATKLDTHTETIAGVYQRKTRKPKGDIISRMTKETWFTAKEAIDFGLADEIVESDAATACAEGIGKFGGKPEDIEKVTAKLQSIQRDKLYADIAYCERLLTSIKALK